MHIKIEIFYILCLVKVVSLAAWLFIDDFSFVIE